MFNNSESSLRVVSGHNGRPAIKMRIAQEQESLEVSYSNICVVTVITREMASWAVHLSLKRHRRLFKLNRATTKSRNITGSPWEVVNGRWCPESCSLVPNSEKATIKLKSKFCGKSLVKHNGLLNTRVKANIIKMDSHLLMEAIFDPDIDTHLDWSEERHDEYQKPKRTWKSPKLTTSSPTKTTNKYH